MKDLARELVAGAGKLPVEKAASRLEAISLLLGQLQMEKAAESMRSAASRCGEGEIALVEAVKDAEEALA